MQKFTNMEISLGSWNHQPPTGSGHQAGNVCRQAAHKVKNVDRQWGDHKDHSNNHDKLWSHKVNTSFMQPLQISNDVKQTLTGKLGNFVWYKYPLIRILWLCLFLKFHPISTRINPNTLDFVLSNCPESLWSDSTSHSDHHLVSFLLQSRNYIMTCRHKECKQVPCYHRADLVGLDQFLLGTDFSPLQHLNMENCYSYLTNIASSHFIPTVIIPKNPSPVWLTLRSDMFWIRYILLGVNYRKIQRTGGWQN